MKILVTGGSGYLGTHVRRFFNADDFSRRSGHDILESDDVKLVENYDVVIHLAAYLDKDLQAAALCFRTNAEGAANVVKQLRPGAIFIYASTKDVMVRTAAPMIEFRNPVQQTIAGKRRWNGRS